MFFYKTTSVNDLGDDTSIIDLFVCDEYYYLQSDVEISGVVQISEEEFQTKKNSVAHIDAITHEPEPELTKTEQAILETAVNVDYLVCLQEMEF